MGAGCLGAAGAGSQHARRRRGPGSLFAPLTIALLTAAILAATTATALAATAPKVTKQPVSATVEVGQSATFTTAASGSPKPTVQWEVSTTGGSSWTPVPGATAVKLEIADAQASESGDEYRAVFANSAGQAMSQTATLTVQDPPRVSEQPASVTVEAGQSATFEAAASGVPAPSVQWEVSTDDGAAWAAVPEATADRLTVADAQVGESGDEYRAVFTNAAGHAASAPATLTVATHHYAVVDWGDGESGQLGDGEVASSDLPVTASGLRYVIAAAGGAHHSLALLSDGTVMAWGSNAFGQLGDELALSDMPVPVEGLSGVRAIAAGNNYSLALLDNGTVMAWGDNESGQLGDGSTQESDVPVAVKDLTGVTAIAAGGEHSLALLSDGAVKAWGENEYGQLGDGSTKNSDVPVAVKELTGVTAIAAGGDHSLALLSDGAVSAWGSDTYGQLGKGAVEEDPTEEGEEEPPEEARHSDLPVTVGGVSGATAVAAGARDSLALLSDGAVLAWGEDKYGELGDGALARDQETPTAVSGLSGATAIAAGGEHSLALLSTGGVMAWGEDRYGELGDGATGAPSDVPVAVSGLGEVAGIAAGTMHDLAYGEPIPGVTGVSPAEGPTSGGTEVTVTGVDLAEATSVRFGASVAEQITADSPTSITVIAPAHAAGAVSVTVTTPAGASPATAAAKFAYIAPPVVKKLSPKNGPATGGTPVTISGEGFSGASTVSFGETPAQKVTVNSATSITAISPEHALGTVDVTVTGPYGASAISSHDRFKFKK